ncbi:MAG: glutamate--tRNA ligase [Anaerolineaceae bacterium]|nr:glutamate--tRNA ligase [Anaerolineaceae bacterium]
MIQEEKPFRVRFAPSPTGRMHLGSARTALFDYLIAKKTGGQFILRIEDTDFKRYMPGAEQEIIDGLSWLGVNYDEGPDIGGPYGPYRQSERKEIYLEHARRLVVSDKAYYCFCSADKLTKVREEQQKNRIPPHYDGSCRDIPLDEARKRVAAGEKHVIRFKTPKNGVTSVHDLLRGEIKVENQTLDDYILVKSDGWALYHLAAMVDDHLMKISHVIRGSEWLPSLPLHSLIIRAFGWEEPVWVHLSVFLKPSGKGKMSKREKAEFLKDGHSIFITDLQELGYLPEAVDNWVALMGWSYDDHTEFFTLDDLVSKFNLENLNPSPAAINFTKLDHFNGLHIRNLNDEELVERIKPFFDKAGYKTSHETLLKIAPIVKERIGTLDDAVEMAGFFFESSIEPKVEDLMQKNLTPEQVKMVLVDTKEILSKISEFSHVNAEEPMRQYVEKSGMSAGQVFGVLRVAVTGQKVSPPLFESMEILGKSTVLERVEKAYQLMDQ